MWDSWLFLGNRPPGPPFSASAHKCNTWNPSATCVCNVCENRDVCPWASPPPARGPALVTPGSLFHFPPLLILQVGCLLRSWVKRVGTAAENTASSPRLPLGRLLQPFAYITRRARYQLRCQPAINLEVKTQPGCS